MKASIFFSCWKTIAAEPKAIWNCRRLRERELRKSTDCNRSPQLLATSCRKHIRPPVFAHCAIHPPCKEFWELKFIEGAENVFSKPTPP